METISDVPNAPTIAGRDAKTGVWHLTCLCPHCGERHHYGGGDGDTPRIGHRAPHCSPPTNGGYILAPATGDALDDLRAGARRDADREKRRLAKERREASAW